MTRDPERRSGDPQGEETAMDWFYLYALGFLMVVAAIALALNLIGVPPVWIIAIALLLLVLGIVTILRPLRSRERS